MILPDIEAYELELCSFLEYRSNIQQGPAPGNDESREPNNRQSIPWIGSLFAVLASGVQYCSDSIQQRQQKSQIYGTDTLESQLGLLTHAA
jgi:hypothetical protein